MDRETIGCWYRGCKRWSQRSTRDTDRDSGWATVDRAVIHIEREAVRTSRIEIGHIGEGPRCSVCDRDDARSGLRDDGVREAAAFDVRAGECAGEGCAFGGGDGLGGG